MRRERGCGPEAGEASSRDSPDQDHLSRRDRCAASTKNRSPTEATMSYTTLIRSASCPTSHPMSEHVDVNTLSTRALATRLSLNSRAIDYQISGISTCLYH